MCDNALKITYDIMISEVARTTGLGMRRKSIRISFDTFMAKSRPGLETGEEEVQVSCDWWRAGHVTTVLTSDWLSGAGGEGEHLLGAAHREEEGEAVRQRAAQVSELNVRDSLHNIWSVFENSYVC